MERVIKSEREVMVSWQATENMIPEIEFLLKKRKLTISAVTPDYYFVNLSHMR